MNGFYASVTDRKLSALFSKLSDWPCYMKRMKRLTCIALLSLCFLTVVRADFSAFSVGAEKAWADRKSGDDEDSVRDAVQNNRIMSLSKVKAIVALRFGNNIIDVEIDRKSGQWIYEFKLINNSGRLVEIEVDARTGTILKVEND